jgi:hypothetical protein
MDEGFGWWGVTGDCYSGELCFPPEGAGGIAMQVI